MELVKKIGLTTDWIALLASLASTATCWNQPIHTAKSRHQFFLEWWIVRSLTNFWERRSQCISSCSSLKALEVTTRDFWIKRKKKGILRSPKIRDSNAHRWFSNWNELRLERRKGRSSSERPDLLKITRGWTKTKGSPNISKIMDLVVISFPSVQ